MTAVAMPPSRAKGLAASHVDTATALRPGTTSMRRWRSRSTKPDTNSVGCVAVAARRSRRGRWRWAGPRHPQPTTYHLFSEWLSLLVKTRSSQAIKRLLDLQPDVARVVRHGVEAEVPIGEVVVGDMVRIRPGERVPVDGQMVDGHSAVDQSLVTGEPVPVERAGGDAVMGGSINGGGTLVVLVSAVGEESSLAQVVRHV